MTAEDSLDTILFRQHQVIGALAMQMAVLKWMTQNMDERSLSVAAELSKLMDEKIKEIKESGL